VTRDLTERLRVDEERERLRESERAARLEAEAAELAVRARDEFLSVAAHELKTPITSMRGMAQLFLRRVARGGALDPGRLQRLVSTIDQQSAKLSTLINQLLDTTRDSAGQLALDRAEVDLVALVSGVVEMAQALHPMHTLTLQTPPRLVALVDAVRLEQVLTNLLDNATKFSPDGGPVEVILVEEGALVCITVRDHGLGVPEELRAHLFERFYQAHSREYRSGMGLGLYITRRIVELHGGTISAEFPPDGGARMVVCLPAR
jgi:signal transduction histidine kinase